MKEKIDNSHIWNAAARTGLIIGLFTGACLTGAQIAEAAGLAGTGLTLLESGLWLLKFFGCLVLMAFFMKKLGHDFEGVSRSDSFRYGRRIALLSALIVAGVNLLLVSTIAREATEAALEAAMEIYAPMLDANAREALDAMHDNLPSLIFISQFLWCWFYGTVLSSILSRFIPGGEK